MTETQIVKLIQRRGLKENLLSLDEGEIGFTTDTHELFIGSSQGNILLAKKSDIPVDSGNSGSVVTDSPTNGYIMVDGVQLQVYSDQVLQQALNGKANSEHGHDLSDITDVDATNRTNGYALQYDALSGKFKSMPLPASEGSGATSLDGLSDVDVTSVSPENGNVLAFNNGVWGPQAYTGGSSSNTSLFVDLNEWGLTQGFPAKPYVDEDYYMADDNITGINNVLKYARDNGYSEVVLPRGDYAVCYPNSIMMQTGVTLNLNRSRLKVIFDSNAQNPFDIDRSTTQDYYKLGGFTVKFSNVVNSHLVNGTLIGCRVDRDLTTVAEAWTEWGYGVLFDRGSSYCTVKYCNVSDYTGDNLSFSTSSPGSYSEFGMGLQVARVNHDTGGLVFDTTNVLTSGLIPITVTDYETIMVTGFGYARQTNIGTRDFGIYFYDENDVFLGGYKRRRIYDDMKMPPNAKQFRLVFYYETDINKNMGVTIRYGGIPHHNTIEYNNISNGHRGGITGGGTYNYIQHNVMINNGIGSSFLTPGKRIFPDPTRFAINQEDSFGDNITIRDNYISGSYSGLLIGCSSVRVFDNHIYNCSYIGINLYSMQYGTIKGNIMDKNQQHIGLMSAHFANAYVDITENSFGGGRISLDTPDNSYFVSFTNNHLRDPEKIAAYRYGIFKDNTILFTNRGDALPTVFTVPFIEGGMIISSVVDGLSVKQALSFDTVGARYKDIVFKDVTIKMPSSGDTELEDVFENCEFINSEVGIEHFNNSKKARNVVIRESTLVNSKARFTSINISSKPRVMRIIDSKIELSDSTITELAFSDTNTESSYSTLQLERCELMLTYPLTQLMRANSGLQTKSISIVLKGTKFKYTGAERYVLKYYADKRSVKKIISAKNTFDNMDFTLDDLTLLTKYDPDTHSLSEPSDGEYFYVGKEKLNADLKAGGFKSWICISEGHASTIPWAPSTSYNIGTVVYVNNRVYKCTTTGITGTVAPVHTSATSVDGAATWQYLGAKATLKPYGLLSE
jgi:parallel beta-helix repeat protein